MLNQEIVQNTINLSKELCVLLQSLHPIKTLHRAYFENMFQHLQKQTEFQIGSAEVQSYFTVEYLQSLFISIDLKNNLDPPTNETKWHEIKKKISQIYQNCTNPFIIDQNNTLTQEEQKMFFRMLISWMQIRGKRPMCHEAEHLNSLLNPHNTILRELYFLWGDLSVSLIIRMPNIQHNFILREYAIKNMLIQEKEKVLLLDIALDKKNTIKDISFKWIKRKNINDKNIKQYKFELCLKIEGILQLTFIKEIGLPDSKIQYIIYNKQSSRIEKQVTIPKRRR